MKRLLPVAIVMILVACGRTVPVQPGPEHVQPVQARPPELPPPEPGPSKTLSDVERDLGLPLGSLKEDSGGFYQAEPGDVLSVTFTSHPRLSIDAPVTPDGSIVFPMIGTLPVRGMQREEVEKAVVGAAQKVGVRNPRVSVSVKSVAKKFVMFVAGGLEGRRLEIHGNGTILETLAASGWKPKYGSARRVALLREGRTTIIDMDRITALRELSLNIRVRSNDILIALDQDPFRVKGSVGFPGDYAVPPSGRLGLQDAIALAGGLKVPVDMESVRILRRDGRAQTVDLNRYLFGGKAQEPVAIHPGDTVWVPGARETTVYVFGMVQAPGLLKVTAPVTVSRVLALAKPAQFGAVLSDCKLVRGYPRNPEVVRVNVENLMRGDQGQDVVMGNGDVLYVPESLGSDVLDTLGRLVGPLSRTVAPSVQLYTASQIRK